MLKIFKNPKVVLFASVIAIGVFFASYKAFDNDKLHDKREVILEVAMQGLVNIHYQPKDINDAFSTKVYDLFLKRLDGGKNFLIKEDLEELKKYQLSLDDEIKAGTFKFFDLSTDLIDKRIKEVQEYYKEILATPFDFEKDESLETDSKKTEYAASKDELKEDWRKNLKYYTLIKLDELMKAQEKAQEKKDSVVKIKTPKELEEEARAKVLKNQNEIFKRIMEVNKDERLADYINVIANVEDPHTEYFAPKDKETFDISMTGQLEGIGAQLQERDGQIRVANIVPGSASSRQGQLKAGDIILKVAQGKSEPVDIADMRIDDVVSLVRGKKGTEVRLTVKKADGSILVIPIIRDVVVIEETYAQSAVIKHEKANIGYIRLPIFYAPNKPGGRSSGDDVKKELIKLKNEKVDGVILDLRENGGGSLQDVVEMAGLFIEKGPIVQVKGRVGSPSVMEDTDASIVYDGPLVVMVNSNSASASEILAAAIQDYKRGIIVGSGTTFGKGTVQRFFNLDDYLNKSYDQMKPLGSIKITMQKFYRVNGGSTQLKGVTPDINLPDPFVHIERGEKDMDNAMEWDEIEKANIDTWKKTFNLEKIKKNSKARVNASSNFKLVAERSDKIKEQKENSKVSLSLKKYQDEQKKTKEDSKRYEAVTKENNAIEVNNLLVDQQKFQADTSRVARNKEWLKSIKKDIYIFEATSVLKDIKEN